MGHSRTPITQQDCGNMGYSRWNFEPITSIQNYYKYPIPAIAHDSNFMLDSNIIVAHTAEVTTKYISVTDTPAFKCHTDTSVDSLARPVGASTFITMRNPQKWFSPVGSKTELILEEGQGIALINREEASSQGNYCVIATFAIETISEESFF